MEFDYKTSQELKSYVYALIDPDDKKPFYIGKNRIMFTNPLFSYFQIVEKKYTIFYAFG